jgi:hypothetical protein
MSIVLVGSTSGSCTLQEQAVAGTTVLTLPTVSGTVLTTGSPQSGGVIQVVNATYGTEVASSSSTYADTGLTATITPKFATSTILVIVNQSGVAKDDNDNHASIKLQRNSSDICLFAQQVAFNGLTSPNRIGGVGCSFLDSPATTSAVVYKTVFNCNQNRAKTTVQTSGSVSTITLMEIAA